VLKTCACGISIVHRQLPATQVYGVVNREAPDTSCFARRTSCPNRTSHTITYEAPDVARSSPAEIATWRCSSDKSRSIDSNADVLLLFRMKVGPLYTRPCVYREDCTYTHWSGRAAATSPLARLESRLMRPRCGSRRVVLVFQPPAEPQAKAVKSA
jgi:hypothetical protein